MSFIDLHTHTTYSDGTYTPEQLIKYALKKELKAIAITDHDTIDSISEGKYYSEKYNIEFISGIEISTHFNKKEIHIVGLFIDEKSPELINKLYILKEKRKKRNIYMVSQLNKIGVDINYEELKNISNGKIITRAHFAKLMLKKGYGKTIKECINNYLVQGKPAYVEKESLNYIESINLITSSGGIAVIAHPFEYNLNDTELEKMIKLFIQYGICAIECFYPTHTLEETKKLLNLCQKYNIKPSGGSDFHGENKPNLDLGTGFGNLSIPYNILTDLKKECKKCQKNQ